MTKQKNRTSEQQLRSVTQAAEAVALGTMAGGLALGAVQAREAQPLPEDTEGVVAPVAVAPAAEGEPQARAATLENASAAPNGPDEARDVPAGLGVEHLTAPPDIQALAPSETAAVVADEVAPADIQAPVAQQISGAIERLVTDVAEVGPTDASALPLAGKILETVADIVSALKPGIDTSALTSLGETIEAQVSTALQPATQSLAELPLAIEESIDAALGSLSTGISDVTGPLGDLASLPASLLGNDGPASDGGLLSGLFYSDGEADLFQPLSILGQSTESLIIPDMSEASSGIMSMADTGPGLLGLSYADLSPDGLHPASGGVGGLGLL